MKRKNTPNPNPVSLLFNLELRKQAHQQRQIMVQGTKSLTMRQQKLISQTNALQEAFRRSITKRQKKNSSTDIKKQKQQVSLTNNKSLRHIYTSTFTTQANKHQKLKSLPQANKSFSRCQYQDVLKILTIPISSDVEDLITDLNVKIQFILQKFEHNNFITLLFMRIKDVIGFTLEKVLQSSLENINKQQKVIMAKFSEVTNENQQIRLEIQKLYQINRNLVQQNKKLRSINLMQVATLHQKLIKENEVNTLIYEIRKAGIDIDEFYLKMKFPQFIKRQDHENMLSTNEHQSIYY